MHLRNTSIGSRLFIGFGIILLLIIITGVAAFMQSNRLWEFTNNLYNHPLQVSKATREIKNNVSSIHLLLKDIALDKELNGEELQKRISQIDSLETDIYKSFNIIYSLYLGQKNHVDSAYTTFKNWKSLRDSVIAYRLKGNQAEAYTQYKVKNELYRNKLFAQIQVIVDFANNRASHYFNAAIIEKQEITFWLSVILAGMLLITASISYLILNSIRRPLLDLANISNQYRQGNYDKRSNYTSTNEIGILATSFNNLAAFVQQQMFLNEKTNQIAQHLIKENELRHYCTELIKILTVSTASPLAVLYLLNDLKTEFEPYESSGLQDKNLRSFAVDASDDNLGKALIQQKTIQVSDNHSDAMRSFQALTGNLTAKGMITIPILNENEFIAVVLLASPYPFATDFLALLDKIHFIITDRLNGVMAFRKITNISLTLDEQYRSLEEKTKKLAMQADELKEYNIELKIQKKEVDEASKYKSAFLSNMSHELRTPLNSIIALSGVLTRKLKNQLPEDEYKYLSIIERNGKHLLELINDILDLSRVESGKEEINISKFSIKNLVEILIESLAPIAVQKGLELISALPDDLPDIESDRSKFQHILQNIISNALKFTEEGSVKITAQKGDDDITIQIADTGIGIDPEYLPMIFDEFKQADSKTSRHYGGTGLGLAIAKKYIILLGGSIEVQTKQDIGSTFYITLPLVNEGYREMTRNSSPQNMQENTQHTPEADTKKTSSSTILLVEDSEIQILQMSYILTKEGYTVKTARNGKQALEFLKSTIPDAMILDLMMPEIDGFQVLESIRSQPETSQIPVLILTAKDITKNELFFLKGSNIDQIIYKGIVNRAELLAQVSGMINHSHSDTGKNQHRSLEEINPEILVIEDNKDNLETVKALLSGKCKFTGTTESNEGLAIARKHIPDLILLDISLSGLDGFSLLEEIHKDEKLMDIPVIALTARAMKGDREELLSYGFDGYISKPIEIEEMERTIERILSNRST